MEIPLSGTSTVLSFFPDDTIENVRQHVALAMNSHPDRLFIQVLTELPADYYSSNPKRWMELFFRLSIDGRVIRPEEMNTYVSQVRVGTGVSPSLVTKEDWEEITDELKPLHTAPHAFKEWRILGVTEDKSFVLPIPPRDIPLQATSLPVPVRQALFETLHPFEVSECKATQFDPDLTTDNQKQVYFPFVTVTTPSNIEPLRASIRAARDQLKRLLALKAPGPSSTSILRAKWYVPLISTRFAAPRVRFEQIFYGMTMSPTTPSISYFTAKQETTRHKFYVEDPKTKVPLLDIPTWKAWTGATQPQRKIPTLLLYRGGKVRNSFDRIAVTPKDITFSCYRGKGSKETLEELKESMANWVATLDALVPFLVPSDLDASRWELNDLSLLASYSTDIDAFDMRRFGCLQSIFNYQGDAFRLLRTDRAFDVSAQVLQAYKFLQESDAVDSKALQAEMGVSPEEAQALFNRVRELEEDERFNFEKELNAYPTILFSPKEAIIKFVSNIERIEKYTSILRYVLTSDAEEIETVCPRRMETVEPVAGVSAPKVEETEFQLDDFLMAELGEAAPIEPVAAAPAAAAPAKVKVNKKTEQGTYNYFNNRVQKFDPEMFDAEYPRKVEKLRQVIVLTQEDQARIPAAYNYSEADPRMKLELKDGAVAICPQYWCMRDELPLSEQQLVEGACPVCGGKVRVTDKEDIREFSVIKRESAFVYPDYKEPSSKTTNKTRVPACYKKPAASSTVIAKQPEDAFYVLTSGVIPALRLAYLPEDLTTRLGIKTSYSTSVPQNRISAGATDMFRVGMGRPRDTLRILLNEARAIKPPSEEKDKVMQCSFFRTWKDYGEGATALDRIVAGIDRAYNEKTLGIMEEIEYVTLLLDCRVMRINTATGTMLCGFWSEVRSPRTRTIVLLDTDVLSRVTRRTAKLGQKFEFVTDVGNFDTTLKTNLQTLHTRACSSDMPTYKDATDELLAATKSMYQVILDPFKRVQALFVPQEIVLPIQPASMDIPMGAVVRNGYNDIKDEELPTAAHLDAFLAKTRNPGFKKTEELYSYDGHKVEFLLASGLRAPIRPEFVEGVHDVREVTKTVRDATEAVLVDGAPNKEDVKITQEISYSSEVFEFLMFSLSKDIQTEEYHTLRASIANNSPTMFAKLSKWLEKEAHWTEMQEPVQFVNKVRTPCGQMKKDTCNKSTLCGMVGRTCRIKVNPIVDKAQVLKRMVTTLRDNLKQRALVLDGRLSPFFSTVLYLEMPNEVITTTP